MITSNHGKIAKSVLHVLVTEILSIYVAISLTCLSYFKGLYRAPHFKSEVFKATFYVRSMTFLITVRQKKMST